MDIVRKIIKLEINGEEMGLVLDFESAMTYQENTGESIFVGIGKVSAKQDIVALANVLASTLRDSEDNVVGLDFVKKLDLFGSLDFFMGNLTTLMDNSVPKEKEKKTVKKKKTILTEI